MRSLHPFNDVSTALNRYSNALCAYSNACNEARCRPGERQLQSVDDAVVLLSAAQRVYLEVLHVA